jgi:hypothetical protein
MRGFYSTPLAVTVGRLHLTAALLPSRLIRSDRDHLIELRHILCGVLLEQGYRTLRPRMPMMSVSGTAVGVESSELRAFGVRPNSEHIF